MDINVIIASTVGLFVITLLLVTMLLFAKAKLLPSGPVKLIINGEKNVEVNSGDTLLTTLGNNKIFYHLHVEVEEHVFSASVKLLKVEERSSLLRNLILQEKKFQMVGD